MKVTFSHKGDFSKADAYFERCLSGLKKEDLSIYGERGVQALKSATPVDTGKTAASWYYSIEETKNGININFNNSNINDGVPIAIILQYGHATKNGGWVQGIDYINPAIQPILEEIAADAWEAVTKK